MYRPLAVFIGLRYTRTKRHGHFVSFISLISMLGLALGVAVLITVLSVLNGFDREIKKQIFGMISPITISNYNGLIHDWKKMEAKIHTDNNVTATAPFISGQGLLSNSDIAQPAMITGILPEKEDGISTIAEKMIAGKLSDLKTGNFGIVLGEELAKHLEIKVGDSLIVATQQGSLSTADFTPHFKNFKVVGIFRAGGGGFGFDSKLAFINLQDAQQLFDIGKNVTGIHVNVNEIYAAPNVAEALGHVLPSTIRIWNWTDILGEYFENIRLTKTMMFFIFILIIAVAIFNLICTMVMVVKNKQSDIAILRTIGATPGMILAVFVVQGAAIGIGGTLLGIIGGVALSSNITALSTLIQNVFHVELVSSSVYFVNYLPAELQWQDVGLISVVALALSLFATLYPAWNAARTEPVEALRYD